MSEWLTTGQMIDRLKIGEVAELSSLYKIPEKVGISYGFLTKNDDGDLLWCTKDKKHRSEEPLNIFGHVCGWKWRILPNYVTFEEAMNALKEGKSVTWTDGIKTITVHQGYFFDIFTENDLTFSDFVNAKWTIEEE